jgi:ketosteroid isomerase-like protein
VDAEPGAAVAGPDTAAAGAEMAGPLAAVVDLFAAIRARDVETILGHYLHEPRLLVFLEGPESKVDGWDEDVFRAGWNALIDTCEFTELRLTGDTRTGSCEALGWVGGTVEMGYRRDPGGVPRQVTSRGTWILERHAGRWLIAFEHVSFAAADPYP